MIALEGSRGVLSQVSELPSNEAVVESFGGTGLKVGEVVRITRPNPISRLISKLRGEGRRGGYSDKEAQAYKAKLRVLFAEQERKRLEKAREEHEKNRVRRIFANARGHDIADF